MSSKQALNAPLRQLLEMQLVAAESDPQDRRAKRLRLTAEGEALEARLNGTQTQQLAAVFANLPSAERQAWLAIMRALAEFDSAGPPGKELDSAARKAASSAAVLCHASRRRIRAAPSASRPKAASSEPV